MCVACNARKRPFCISIFIRVLKVVLGSKNSTNDSWGLINIVGNRVVSKRVDFP
jgi:hypothetical protein